MSWKDQFKAGSLGALGVDHYSDLSRQSLNRLETSQSAGVIEDFIALSGPVDRAVMKLWPAAIASDDQERIASVVDRTLPDLDRMYAFMKARAVTLQRVLPVEAVVGYELALESFIEAGGQWLVGDAALAAASMRRGTRFWERAIDDLQAE